MDENGSGPRQKPYWGEVLKEDLREEIRAVSAQVAELGKQVRAKPSKNWVRVLVGTSFGSIVAIAFGFYKETKAELAEHVKEEKQDVMQVRTEVQSAANRLDGKMDKILLRLVPRRRHADEGGGQ